MIKTITIILKKLKCKNSKALVRLYKLAHTNGVKVITITNPGFIIVTTS